MDRPMYRLIEDDDGFAGEWVDGKGGTKIRITVDAEDVTPRYIYIELDPGGGDIRYFSFPKDAALDIVKDLSAAIMMIKTEG